MSEKVIFRCDAGSKPEIGSGHIMRSINLANDFINQGLIDRNDVVFYTRNDNQFQLGEKLLLNSGFKYKVFSNNELRSNSQSEINILRSSGASLIIMDRLATTKELVRSITSKDKKVVTFDDYGSGRSFATFSICAILDDLPKADNLYKGYDFLILSNKIKEPSNFNELPSRIVATFGGHDSRDLTQHFIDNISDLPDYCSVDIIIGTDLKSKLSAYSKKVELLRSNKKVMIHSRPSNYYQILSKADIGVCSGGLSIFEFALSGIASIGLPQYKHQLNTILKLEKDRICLLGSNNMNLSNEKLNSSLKTLLNNSQIRQEISNNATKKIHSNGLKKVTKLFKEKFSNIFSNTQE